MHTTPHQTPLALKLWLLGERLRRRALDENYAQIRDCTCTPIKPCAAHHGAWSFIRANQWGAR